jgi:hypothetical protein
VLAPGTSRIEALQALTDFAKDHGYAQLKVHSFVDPRPDDPLPEETARVLSSRALKRPAFQVWALASGARRAICLTLAATSFLV